MSTSVSTGESSRPMPPSCPECGGKLTFANQPHLSEIIECANCRTELEVVATNPLMLALAPEPEEDWGE